MISIAKPIDLRQYKNVDDGTRIVSAISIIGVPTYPKKIHLLNGTHLVHWRVHLRWTGKGRKLAQGSVVLDTYKNQQADPIVTINVHSKASVVSNYASKFWEFMVPVIKPNLSVHTVVGLITASAKLLVDYVAAGYVHAQAIPDFTEFIAKTRKAEASSYWIPDDQGTYI